MPPFTTVNGQTGYYYNGQFVPATQQEYNALFNAPQTQNNPFLQQVLPQNIQPPLMGGRQDFVQQGTIQSPETAAQTNEQKVMQTQGNNDPILGVGNMPYVKMGNEYGVQRGKSFFGFDAMTASGHPLNTATNTVYNTGDLTSFRKGKLVNPLAAEVALIQSQNTQNTLNALNNPTTPIENEIPTVSLTERQVNNPDGGNWFTKMFNKPSVEGVQNTGKTGNVLGSQSGWKLDAEKAFTGSPTTSLIGGGINAVSKLIGANAGNYDERVGMTNPNLGGTLLGDATFTQMGSMFGPAGMAIGGTVDLLKNAVKYVKQKDKYENKKLATDTMQGIDDARENMKPDYTGYARFGTQVKNPYLKKYKNGGEGDPEDPDFITPFLTGLASNVQKGLSYGIEQGKNAINYLGNAAEGLQKYQQLPEPVYRWSNDGYSAPTSSVQNTEPSGINYTNPSIQEYQVLYNPEDDYLKNYVGKSLGSNPFIFKNRMGVAQGYAPNNAWMSNYVGTTKDPTTILGHLASRYDNNYDENLKNNDIPSIYFFEKDLANEKKWEEDVMVGTDKYRRTLTNKLSDYELEKLYIDNFIKSQNYGHNIVSDENGNKLIRSFTPDKDKFMGSVTLTPEMYKIISESKNQTEAKRRLMKMAKIPEGADISKLYMHMNLNSPKYLNTYYSAKSKNPNIDWGDNMKNIPEHKMGGIVQNPYLITR